MTVHAPIQDEIIDYTVFIGDLMDAIKISDDCQWLCGDRLQGVETRYREHTLEQIADEVGKHPSTLFDWKRMSAFYDPSTRAYYKEIGLSYSHLKVGMRHFDTLDAACEFLDIVAREKWSVRGAQIEVKAFKGEAAVKSAALTVALTFRQGADGRVTVEGVEGSPIVPGVLYEAKLTPRGER